MMSLNIEKVLEKISEEQPNEYNAKLNKIGIKFIIKFESNDTTSF